MADRAAAGCRAESATAITDEEVAEKVVAAAHAASMPRVEAIGEENFIQFERVVCAHRHPLA
jgi:preprotein translocase subunit SecA